MWNVRNFSTSYSNSENVKHTLKLCAYVKHLRMHSVLLCSTVTINSNEIVSVDSKKISRKRNITRNVGILHFAKLLLLWFPSIFSCAINDIPDECRPKMKWIEMKMVERGWLKWEGTEKLKFQSWRKNEKKEIKRNCMRVKFREFKHYTGKIAWDRKTKEVKWIRSKYSRKLLEVWEQDAGCACVVYASGQ